jgi:hypothetical protein
MQETPCDTWVVTHNLKLYPTISAFTLEGASHKKIVPTRITYASNDVCILEFNTPELGVAITI